jgi:hypothetical protein
MVAEHVEAGRHSTLQIGHTHRPHPAVDGGLCDVRLYSRALSEAEVRALYEGEQQLVSAEGWRRTGHARGAKQSSGQSSDRISACGRQRSRTTFVHSKSSAGQRTLFHESLSA